MIIPELAFSLDSIFKAPDSVVIDSCCQQVPSLFSNHELPMLHSNYEALCSNGPASWIFILLVSMALLICLFFHKHHLLLLDLLHAVADKRVLNRIIRNSHFDRVGALFLCGLFFTTSLSLAAFFFLSTNKAPNVEAWIVFLTYWVAITAFFFIRNGLIRTLGHIFDNDEASKLCVVNNYSFAIIEAILLIPILLIAYYAPFMHHGHISLSILIAPGILLLLRLIQSIQLILTFSKSSKLFLFYYLCIVEIVPLLILYKAFILL